MIQLAGHIIIKWGEGINSAQNRWQLGDTPHGVPVVLVVVVVRTWVDATAIEVQIVGVVRITGVDRRGPVPTVAAR